MTKTLFPIKSIDKKGISIMDEFSMTIGIIIALFIAVLLFAIRPKSKSNSHHHSSHHHVPDHMNYSGYRDTSSNVGSSSSGHWGGRDTSDSGSHGGRGGEHGSHGIDHSDSGISWGDSGSGDSGGDGGGANNSIVK